MNFLTLPQIENSMAIFGSGFGVANLKNASWLKSREIFYWGDIDTHGLQILSQIKGYFKGAKSFLMDYETLDYFREDWDTGEPTSANYLPNLNAEEERLFHFIKGDNKTTIRLEQEKISNVFVIKKLETLFNKDI